jgi:hypothetical protein
MYLDEAVIAMEMNLRSVCMMLEVVRRQQLEKAKEEHYLPMQDFLADLEENIDERTDPETCLDYMKSLYKGLKYADEHVKLARRSYIMEDPEEANLVDILFGSVYHNFPDNYAQCARECYVAYQRMLPVDPDSSDKTRRKWIAEVMHEFERIAKKHNVKIVLKGKWRINESYLAEWLNYKFWEVVKE